MPHAHYGPPLYPPPKAPRQRLIDLAIFLGLVVLVAAVTLVAAFFCERASAQPVGQVPALDTMELPAEIRGWFRNPDGSCVQCSIGMCGVWCNVPQASTLLWDTEYGPAVRGGSWPSRVAGYCDTRKMPAFNVTGENTWEWMAWACHTGRFAAIGAGQAHFQTLYGRDAPADRWYVCNNNSPHKIDEYSGQQFRKLHLASGPWVVILDCPAPPPPPRYVRWWQ